MSDENAVNAAVGGIETGVGVVGPPVQRTSGQDNLEGDVLVGFGRHASGAAFGPRPLERRRHQGTGGGSAGPMPLAWRGGEGSPPDALDAGHDDGNDNDASNGNGFVLHPNDRNRLQTELMYDNEEDRRLRGNQRECASVRRDIARTHGRFVRGQIEDDVRILRQQSLEDSSDEAYSVAGCDEERAADLAAGDRPPDERSPRGVRRRQRMETRQRARVVQEQNRSRRQEAELQEMLQEQFGRVESMLTRHHEGAVAEDRAWERRDREAADLAAVGRDEAGEDTQDVDGATSTRLLLNRAHAALGRARALQDGEHIGIDEEGDLELRGRVPRPVEEPGVVEGPLQQEGRGGEGWRPAIVAAGEERQDRNRSEWVPATFQDRRHIGRHLTRLLEDFRRISAHERADVALMLRHKRDDEAVADQLTEAHVATITRRWHEDRMDGAYSDSSDEA